MFNVIIYLEKKKIDVSVKTIRHYMNWANEFNDQLDLLWPRVNNGSVYDAFYFRKFKSNFIFEEKKQLGEFNDIKIKKLSFIFDKEDLEKLKETEDYKLGYFEKYTGEVDYSFYSIDEVCQVLHLNGITSKKLYPDLKEAKTESIMTMVIDNVLPDRTRIKEMKSFAFHCYDEFNGRCAKVIAASKIVNGKNVDSFLKEWDEREWKESLNGFSPSTITIFEKFEKKQSALKLEAGGSFGPVKYLKSLDKDELGLVDLKSNKNKYLEVSQNIYFVESNWLFDMFYPKGSLNPETIGDFEGMIKQTALLGYSMFVDWEASDFDSIFLRAALNECTLLKYNSLFDKV